VSDGAPIKTLTGHELGVNAVAFTPDSRRVVSASGDETVRVWNLESGEALQVIRGHAGPVLGVAVSPDGRQVASAGLDGTVRLWDLETGANLAVLEGHFDPVWSVRFTPGGDRLVSAGSDETLRVWDLASGQEIGEGTQGVWHAPSWDDGSRGAQLFRKCSACHTLSADGGNKAGPTLYGLFGRPFGQVSGYHYSEALQNSDLVWNEKTVDALFAQGPADYVPGSKMPLQRMPNAADRAELIGFLKRVTRPQP
jgi:cytochrome c